MGGTGDDADTFSQGNIGKVSVAGSMSDSTIGAGLTSPAGVFDLPWLEANDAFVEGSIISSVKIGGTLTSSGNAAFGIGAYDVVSASAGTDKNPALVYSEI